MVLSLLFSQNKHEVLSLYELGEYRTGETIMGIKVLQLATSFGELNELKTLFF